MRCICSPHQIASYKKRLSGPLLDRIDLHVSCPSLPPEKLVSLSEGEKSSEIRKRVQSARDQQTARYKDKGMTSNAELSAKNIKEFCPLDEATVSLLRQAAATMNISGRGFHRILKVARTIADLEGANAIEASHVMEALQYRQKMD